MSRNVTISTEIASAQAEVVAARLANGWIRIYEGTRPGTADDPAGDAKLIVELQFPGAEDIRQADGVVTTGPLTPGVATSKGRPRWFRISSATGATILDGDCGTLDGDQACGVSGNVIEQGQVCRCSKYVHDVRGDDR